ELDSHLALPNGIDVPYNFSGKVVLITGSSSGIGAATAVQFSRAGARVVVTGRRADRVSQVAEECLKVSPNRSKALEVVADVTKPEDLRRLVDTTIAHFGKLNVLVNNAGAGIVAKIGENDFYENYLKVMQINLNSVVYLTHICVEHLEKTKGNVVNISSLASINALTWCAPYCMSKAAMDMFTKCMAAELGPKRIRVNGINPCGIPTDFMKSVRINMELPDKNFKSNANLTQVGRMGEPVDVANSILYLASDQAAFVTGANLFVDGGISSINANA
ncbi:unnamed protein product, partial [Oppiella nova]